MDKIKITVDKRIELIGIMLRLSNYGDSLPHLVYDLGNYEYLDRANKWFLPFKKHKAIQTLNKIIAQGNFSYDAPVTLFLQLDEKWNFFGQNEYPFVNRLNKDPMILQFIKETKDFVRDTNFEQFFIENQETYKNEVESFKRSQDLTKVMPFMKQLFKSDFSDRDFQVNLALLLTGGGFASWVNNVCYCTDCKLGDREGNALNYWRKNSAIGQSHYLHEFCHSVINPLTDKYINSIKMIIPSQEDKEKLTRSAYGDAITVINEYIIRAIQVVYIKEQGDDPEGTITWWNDKLGFNKQVILKLADKVSAIKDNAHCKFEEEYVELANIIAESYSQLEY